VVKVAAKADKGASDAVQENKHLEIIVGDNPSEEPRGAQQPLPFSDDGQASSKTTDGVCGKKSRRRKTTKYKLPSITLLNSPPKPANGAGEQQEAADCIIRTLQTYGVTAEVSNIIRGPRVTRVEVSIGMSEATRMNKIEALSDEISYALPAKSVRIEAPIPGKRAVGIEFPNRRAVVVTLRELLDDERFINNKSLLCMAIAKDLGGEPVYADLSNMPHLLIAGHTGSGKTVCLNACIISLICRARPEELRLILIDPKLVEMAPYEGLPHLLTEVVNDVGDAINSLRWAVEEMRERFKLFKKTRVNNLDDYNAQIRDESERLPYIVIVVDEMADLMVAEPIEMERLIAALTRLARAVGIHLVLATQRPDVKVITGGIKANIPARIAFRLPSQHDSRTVLNCKGAEKLLGNGDMLFQAVGESKSIRAQGALVTKDEIYKIVKFWTEQGEPEFDEEVLRERSPEGFMLGKSSMRDITPDDQRYLDEAIRLIWAEQEASVSMLQRKLGIGYPKAGRLMEYLEELGLVGPKAGSKPREIRFGEAHPALKLFDDDSDYEYSRDLEPKERAKPIRREDKQSDFADGNLPVQPGETIDGDFATGEITGI
jgi:S-DNA-T family DNA segregation ATPase FtsK/SpoIIIE